MEREIFAARFHEASARARDFAREYVEEALPEPMLFQLQLNASYDGNPLHADERVFPEDSGVERSRCSGDDVVNTLWRNGLVPEWINLCVSGEIGTATLIEVSACGRFTANEQLLYHEHEGRPPFHVLGPALPIDYERGQKFSIYDRSRCSSLDDLRLTAQHAGKVWSLELTGRDFDDEVLASLPVFERMEILELRGSVLNGSGLRGLSVQPALRVLRINLSNHGPFSAERLPQMPRLNTLTIDHLPSGPWGFSAVAAQAINSLRLESDHELVLDACLEKPLQELSLHARSLRSEPFPGELGSLHLEVKELGDEEIERLVARVRTLKYLTLTRTRVTERVVEALVSRWTLKYLNVVGTSVGADCLQRIRARYPKLRIHF